GLNLQPEEVVCALAGARAVVAIPDARDPEAFTTTAKWERLQAAVGALVTAAHEDQPLAAGVEMESVRTRLPWDVSPTAFRWCIDQLVAAGGLVRDESLLRL